MPEGCLNVVSNELPTFYTYFVPFRLTYLREQLPLGFNLIWSTQNNLICFFVFLSIQIIFIVCKSAKFKPQTSREQSLIIIGLRKTYLIKTCENIISNNEFLI